MLCGLGPSPFSDYQGSDVIVFLSLLSDVWGLVQFFVYFSSFLVFFFLESLYTSCMLLGSSPSLNIFLCCLPIKKKKKKGKTVESGVVLKFLVLKGPCDFSNTSFCSIFLQQDANALLSSKVDLRL